VTGFSVGPEKPNARPVTVSRKEITISWPRQLQVTGFSVGAHWLYSARQLDYGRLMRARSPFQKERDMITVKPVDITITAENV
jgi:hypothetical protein